MNQRGQALIESILILPVIVFLFVLSFYVVTQALHKTILDDLLEDLLICHKNNETNCDKYLKLNLTNLNIQAKSLKYFTINKNVHVVFIYKNIWGATEKIERKIQIEN